MIGFEKQVDEKIKDFYKKYFSKAAKEGKEVPLEYCINKAWADATQRERFNGQQSEIIKNKDKIKNYLENQIRDRMFSNNYDEWHRRMCSQEEYLPYGIWQKFINMTFKYMYCYRQCKDEKEFYDIKFEDCHCPIDRVITKRADTLCIVCGLKKSEIMTSIAESGENNWNNMNEEQYQEVRKKIREITEKCTINNSDTRHPTELEFDFLLW